MENNAKNTRYHPSKQRPASPGPQHPKQRQVGGLRGVSPWRKELVQGVRCGWEKDASDLHTRQELREGTEGAPCVGGIPTGSPSPQVWAASGVG